MTIYEIFNLPSFQGASLIVGPADGKQTEVTGIMVLESLDVERWAHPGEIILSSYFALSRLSNHQLEDFVKHLANLQICALAIKLDRLVPVVPDPLITYCSRHLVPLIQIPGDVLYEHLILDVLTPIIHSHATALNQFYGVHQKLARLALKEPSVQQLLEELKQMTGLEVSLSVSRRQEILSTCPEKGSFTILRREPVNSVPRPSFACFGYRIVWPKTEPDCPELCTGVVIPNIIKDEAVLYLHGPADLVLKQFLPVIENFAFFLQMELLKQASIRRNTFFYKNELIHSLLDSNYSDPASADRYLTGLRLNQYPYYQVIQFQSQNQEPAPEDSPYDGLPISRAFELVCQSLASLHIPHAFGAWGNRLTVLFNLPSPDRRLTADRIQELLRQLQRENPDLNLSLHTGLSSLKSKDELEEAHREVLKIQQVLALRTGQLEVCSYENLGIYQLFFHPELLMHPEILIPPDFSSFCAQHPELAVTLETYLEHGQNSSATAKLLYLHPKTIRYRLEKIRELLNLDFRDSERILQLQIAFRAMKLFQ